jgi:hypothetical protein
MKIEFMNEGCEDVLDPPKKVLKRLCRREQHRQSEEESGIILVHAHSVTV